MKRKIQLVTGGICLAIGIVMFAYFGSRQRPGFDRIEQEVQRQALIHDIATVAGLLLLFLGIVLLILGAVSRWNEQHAEADEQSRL